MVDHVEDTMWWDDQPFVAITNDGEVRGLRVDGTVVFEDQHAGGWLAWRGSAVKGRVRASAARRCR